MLDEDVSELVARAKREEHAAWETVKHHEHMLFGFAREHADGDFSAYERSEVLRRFEALRLAVREAIAASEASTMAAAEEARAWQGA